MGAWIEIDKEIYNLGFDESLPLWERGLKYMRADNVFEVDVAPLVGAWIEIAAYVLAGVSREVAPLVGAWIEIIIMHLTGKSLRSLPLWERELQLPFGSSGSMSYWRCK